MAKIQSTHKGKVSLHNTTAIFVLAMAFTLSCSGGDDDGGSNNNGGDNGDWKYFGASRCRSGVIEVQCGGTWYNVATHACNGGIV